MIKSFDMNHKKEKLLRELPKIQKNLKNPKLLAPPSPILPLRLGRMAHFFLEFWNSRGNSKIPKILSHPPLLPQSIPSSWESSFGILVILGVFFEFLEVVSPFCLAGFGIF